MVSQWSEKSQFQHVKYDSSIIKIVDNCKELKIA